MNLSVHAELPDSEQWPIAAAMLPFGAAHQLSPDTWRQQLHEVALEGFTDADLTDSWIRVGDLEPDQLAWLSAALSDAGVSAIAVSAIRRSILDPVDWRANLAYLHRTIDAAAALGCSVVSVGLHSPLTDAQREAFWFWTAPGPAEQNSPDARDAAVARFRELGRHAEESSMQLSLEMYEDTLLGSSESAVRMVEEIGLDSVGLNPDLANIYRLHRNTEPFLDAVDRCMPHANYWHVKSYYRDVDPATGGFVSIPAPMATGSMDYRAAIKLAVAHGFAGPFCVEHYGGDGLTVMAGNCQYVRKLLRVARADSHHRTVGESVTVPGGPPPDPQ